MSVGRIVGGDDQAPLRPYAPARRDDATGRRWTFKVPNAERGGRELVIHVDYADDAGSAAWGIRIRPRSAR